MPTVARRKLRWYAVLWIKETKKRKWIPLPTGVTTKREASALARKLDENRFYSRNGLGISPTNSAQTLSEVAGQWIADIEPRISAAKFDAYKRAIQRFLNYIGEDRTLVSVHVQECRNFITDQLEKEYSADTIRMAAGRLRNMFQRAIDDGYLRVNPWASIKAPPKPVAKPRFLLPAELRKLLAAAPESRRLRWALLAYTGARPSEARKITWRDIDFKTRTITIVSAQKGRGGNARRTVPILDELMPYLKKHKKDKGRVLTGSDYNWLREIKLDAQKARLECEIDVYALRHTYGTIFYAANEDLLTVRDLMGHKSIKTTEIYTHVIPKNHDKAVKAVSEFLRRNSVDEDTG